MRRLRSPQSLKAQESFEYRACRAERQLGKYLSEQDMTQTRFASLFGCHQSKVSRFLSGRWKPSMSSQGSIEFLERVERVVFSPAIGACAREDASPNRREAGDPYYLLYQGHRRHVEGLLDAFNGAAGVTLLDIPFAQAMCGPTLYRHRMCGIVLELGYGNLLVSLCRMGLAHTISSSAVRDAIHKSCELEEQALASLPPHPPVGNARERVIASAGLALAGGGLLLHAQATKPDAYCPHAEAGLKRLSETAATPHTWKDGLLSNFLRVVDLALEARYDYAEAWAARAAEVARSAPADLLATVLSARRLRSLRRYWKQNAPDVFEGAGNQVSSEDLLPWGGEALPG